jgi:hypothetical protein
LKQIDASGSGDAMDIFEVVALAKRLNISFADMKEMTFSSLMNILLSTVESDTKQATQTDINALLGG